jgi:hypothetical protein
VYDGQVAGEIADIHSQLRIFLLRWVLLRLTKRRTHALAEIILSDLLAHGIVPSTTTFRPKQFREKLTLIATAVDPGFMKLNLKRVRFPDVFRTPGNQPSTKTPSATVSRICRDYQTLRTT